jgi:hypothetical protein
MNRDDIIKALDWHAPTVEMGPQSLLQRIESLVAQAEAAEREACAKLAASKASVGDASNYPTYIAAAIRARGQA